MTAEKSGGLFIANVAGLGFFLAAAATVSVVFIPMYMGYSVSSGLQLYKRGFQGICHDIHAFMNKVHSDLNKPVRLPARRKAA